MSNYELLDRPIAFQRAFVTLTGSVHAALMLSQAVYWQKRCTSDDGWWWKTQEEWQEETGMTRREQETARKKCAKYLEYERRGVPAKLYWHIKRVWLDADLTIKIGGKRQTGLAESANQDVTKAPIIKDSETTSETTQKDSPHPTPQQEMLQALVDVTQLDPNFKTTAGRIGKAAAALIKAEYLPAHITRAYQGEYCWWRQNDWRGKKFQPPTPEQIIETIGQAVKKNGKTVVTVPPDVEVYQAYVKNNPHGAMFAEYTQKLKEMGYANS